MKVEGKRETLKVKDLQVRNVTEVADSIRKGKSPMGLPSSPSPRPLESPFARSRSRQQAPARGLLGKKLVFGPKGKGKKKHKPRTSKRLFRGNRIRSWKGT